MKLQSVVRARSIWLFNAADINPHGLSLAELLPRLVERYAFVTAPTPKEVIEAQQGIAFKGGTFRASDGRSIAVELSSYRDGVIGDTRSSTDDSDQFLKDLLEWGSTNFGLRKISAIKVRRVYINEVFVTCDRPLDQLNPKLKLLAKTLNEYLADRGSPRFELSHIQLSINPPLGPNQPPGFKFELAEPREENRYYSFAPLRTEDHMRLLSDLYEILK